MFEECAKFVGWMGSFCLLFSKALKVRPSCLLFAPSYIALSTCLNAGFNLGKTGQQFSRPLPLGVQMCVCDLALCRKVKHAGEEIGKKSRQKRRKRMGRAGRGEANKGRNGFAPLVFFVVSTFFRLWLPPPNPISLALLCAKLLDRLKKTNTRHFWCCSICDTPFAFQCGWITPLGDSQEVATQMTSIGPGRIWNRK